MKYAIGPDREVFVIVGDGSYLMMHTELVTSLMEHQKIILVLFNSLGFNSINNLSIGNGSDGFGNDLRERNPDTGLLDGAPVDIDFAANARSYGCAAYTVNSMAELEEALQSARNETKTTLIHVHVVKGTNSNGYNSWWRVGVAEVSAKPRVQAAYEDMQEKRKMARKY